ncbi:MAG: tetratricopeptide repeat protein [Desulfomonilaceae bacterium]
MRRTLLLVVIILIISLNGAFAANNLGSQDTRADEADEAYKTGLKYYNAEGVKQDYQEAMKWFMKAANQGDSKAQRMLGIMYFNGEGVPKDCLQTIKWWVQAADNNDAKAQYNLALIYYNGECVPKNFSEAMKWYRKAADQGMVQAQNNIGWMYDHGEGVTQNYTEAMKWYQKAADQGHAKAQLNIGWMYDKGLGVTKDYTEAAKWYQKAAEQGHASAQSNLGKMFRKGEGVPRNISEALKWYQKAADQGDKKAQGELKMLRVQEVAEKHALSEQANKPSSVSFEEIRRLFINPNSPLTEAQQEREWKKFEGSKVQWRGVVWDVTQGWFGVRVEINMNVGSWGTDISLRVSEKDKERALNLNKGQVINFTGVTFSQPGAILPMTLGGGVTLE